MNFQSLKKVENYQFYIDTALAKARKKVDDKKGTIRREGAEREKQIEVMRIQAIRDSLSNSLKRILTSFPSISMLPPFYKEMVKNSLDYVQLKQSLGAVNWAERKINDFFMIYNSRIRRAQEFRRVRQHSSEFIGRIASVLKQIRESLSYLEEARRAMREFPTIKTSVKTACIIGFPNVGKTTLLFKLTGSRPAIEAYPFTTKGINVAYINAGSKRIQLIDTPGTLNRFEKMNRIEKQAYLAMKHLAELLIYVFDLTEPYPIDEQMKLYKSLAPLNKKIVVYLSKTDILPKEDVERFRKELKENIITGDMELKELLLEEISSP